MNIYIYIGKIISSDIYLIYSKDVLCSDECYNTLRTDK